MASRPPRKYAIYYRKRGVRKWKRLHPTIQGSKDSIIQLYQTLLIYDPIDNREYSIRPIPRKKIK